MASAKRTQYQRDRDLADIARMYLVEHKTQYQIMVILNADPDRPYTLSRQQIGYDLRSLRNKWLKSALVDFNEARSAELARIDWLEQEYQDAWEKSKELVTARGTSGDDNPTITTTYGPGNPAFLSGIERCITMRIKLLGLDAPRLLEIVESDFDQAAWAANRDARHAAALKILAESSENNDNEDG